MYREPINIVMLYCIIIVFLINIYIYIDVSVCLLLDIPPPIEAVNQWIVPDVQVYPP